MKTKMGYKLNYTFDIIILIVFVSAFPWNSHSIRISETGSKLYSAIECVRECRVGEPSRICYYNFTLEFYSAMGQACNICTPTPLNQFLADCECVLGDGYERTVLTANRMIPGPSIQVCENDTVVIDVKNRILNNVASIHWHGILQKGTQYYDGVPMVTQCPIVESNTFRYKWYAVDVGTYFWHSHSGLQKLNGLYGSIIIRQPKSVDIHGDLYDYDLPEHVIVISDWFHELAEEHWPGYSFDIKKEGQTATNLLINGRGRYREPGTNNSTLTPYEVFEVEKGKRYRFRIVNAQATVCASIFAIEDHDLLLIAADGAPVKPVKVNSIISLSGERYDFILEANKRKRSYWIQLRGLQECGENRVQQFGYIKYKNSALISAGEEPTYDQGLPDGIILNPLDGRCNITRPNAVCINQLVNAVKTDPQLSANEKPDLQIYMPYEITFPDRDEIYKPPNPYKYTLIVASPGVGTLTGVEVNNITYIEPSSPLISQYTEDHVCSHNKLPRRCVNSNEPCECSHVVDVPLKSLVELILIDQSGQRNLTHPFHLHGYYFNVLAIGESIYPNATEIDIDLVRKADKDGLIKRSLTSPPYKDTIAVPASGYAIVRFRADNPGFWFFHCHFVYHIALGMNFVVKVGDLSDLPPVPNGFPKCGNFLPPI